MGKRVLVLVACLASAVAAAASPEFTTYAYCDRSPRVDQPPLRELSVTVTRASKAVELVSLSLKGARALREARSATELRAWFDGARCGQVLELEVQVRDLKTKQTRTVVTRAQVQQVD